MLKLHVDNKEQSEPVVRLRWTITERTLKVLEKKEVEEPFLFLSITNRGYEVDRVLVPLKQGMEYVLLNRTGNHKFHAFIVWNGGFFGQEDVARNLLLKDSPTTFRRNLYYDVAFQKENLGKLVGGFMAETEIEVNVSPEFFAKEPAEWEKWWVNLWFKYPALDQCEFRKRRFLAYIVQVLPVLLYVIWHFVVRGLYAIFLTLIGMRRVKYSAIIHPFDMYTDRMADDCSNFFTEDGSGADRHASFLLLHPLPWAVLLFGVYGLTYWHLWDNLLATVAVVVIVIVLIIAFCITKDVIVPKFERVIMEGRGDISDIVIKGKPKMTVYLRYKEIKARVCRPYARG